MLNEPRLRRQVAGQPELIVAGEIVSTRFLLYGNDEVLTELRPPAPIGDVRHSKRHTVPSKTDLIGMTRLRWRRVVWVRPREVRTCRPALSACPGSTLAMQEGLIPVSDS